MMNHLVIAPILLPLLMGIVLLLLSPTSLSQTSLTLRRALSVAGVVGQIVLAVLLLDAVRGGEILVYALGNWQAPFGIVLVADRLAVWMLLVTALLALFALLYALRGTDRGGRHFHVLFQLQLFGLNGAFLTGDLFNLFVFFEILLLASYALLLHGGGRLRTRAGLHFVVINLAGSTLFLFAVGTLYGVTGTLNMADLAVKVAAADTENIPLIRAAGLLLFGVFALKAALLPLYLWLPAAYANISAPVAALFAIMTKVGAYSILRVYTLIFGTHAVDAASLIVPWLLPLALVTLLVGMLGAMASNTLRQQIAYLVIASVGALLTAFGLDNSPGIGAGLYYLAHSSFAAAALFLLADVIARQRGEMEDRLHPGLVIANPRLLGALFFVGAVLIVGMPPLSGFIGKFLILRAALPHPALPWVMGVVLVGSLLGMIALARSGSLLFYRAQPGQTPATSPGYYAKILPIIGLLGLCLALTIWAGAASDYTRATAEQLLQPSQYIHAVLGTGGKQ